MMDMLYLGIGIFLMIILNAAYVGWRGGQLRKAKAERDDPFNNR